MFTLQPFARQYFNSAYIAVVVTLGTLAVASMTARPVLSFSSLPRANSSKGSDMPD